MKRAVVDPTSHSGGFRDGLAGGISPVRRDFGRRY